MHQLIERTLTLADRFIPERIHQQGPEEVHGARLLLLVTAAIVIWGPVFVAVTAALQAWSLTALVASATLFVAATPLVLRRTARRRLCSHYLISALVYVLLGNALLLGGRESSSLYWLLTLPLLGTMLLGRSGGALWAVLTAAALGIVGGLDVAGVALPQVLTGRSEQLYWVATAISSAVVIYSLGFNWSTMIERMQGEVAQASAATQEAHNQARMVLDSISQGLLLIDPDGRISPQHSASVESLLGHIEPGDTLVDLLDRVDSESAAWLAMGLEGLRDGFMPLEVVLEQMPHRIQSHGHLLEAHYETNEADGELVSLLVILTDVTERVRLEEQQLLREELLEVVSQVARDRKGFLDYLEEGRGLVEDLAQSSDRTLTLRMLHTLKGNSGLVGVQSLAAHCHDLETLLIETGEPLDEDQICALRAAWTDLEQRVAPLLGERADGMVIAEGDLHTLEEAIAERQPHALLEELLASWRLEAPTMRLQRLKRQVEALGARQGKPLTVHVSHDQVRLDPQVWSPFWSSLVHILRNAVDHGIEEDREAAGKPEEGRIDLLVRALEGQVQVVVRDDGAGIAWERLADKARERGLPHASRDELAQLLFRDGVTTRETANALSGRGVGTAATKEACEALGGRIAVHSEPGRGTEMVFSFPVELAWTPRPALRAA